MKPTSLLIPGLALGSLLALPVPGRGQTSPFLPEARYRALVNEISGDRAYENVRWLTHYHRTGGSADFFLATEWIKKAAMEAGLEDVKLIRQKYRRDRPGRASFGEAWLVEPEETQARGLPTKWRCHDRRQQPDDARRRSPSSSTSGAGVKRRRTIKGSEVKGKIVLAWGSPTEPSTGPRCWKRGALGVLSHATNRPGRDRRTRPGGVAEPSTPKPRTWTA